MILLMNVGLIVGGPCWGHLSDKLLSSRKWVVVIGMLCMGGILATIARLDAESDLWKFVVLFFGFGFSSSSGMVMYAHIKDLMPIKDAGLAMTGINFFTMVGAAIFIQGMGTIMQWIYPRASMSLDAFRGSFTACAILLVAITFIYALTTDTRPEAGRQ
jgi:MFS family permease